MARILTDATTVGEAVNEVLDNLLDGLLRADHRVMGKRDAERLAAQRHAVQLLAEDLNSYWCSDANTRLADVVIPS
jgi:hypothetical protein